MEVFLWQHHPISRFLAKTLRLNKIAMKSFSKICRLEWTLSCRSHYSYIKQHEWCEKLGRNSDWGVRMANCIGYRYFIVNTFSINKLSIKRKFIDKKFIDNKKFSDFKIYTFLQIIFMRNFSIKKHIFYISVEINKQNR